MAQVVVRGLDEDTKHRLKQRAKANKRSMEAEIRHILQAAVKPVGGHPSGLATRIAEIFKDIDFQFEIPELRGSLVNPPDFSEPRRKK